MNYLTLMLGTIISRSFMNTPKSSQCCSLGATIINKVRDVLTSATYFSITRHSIMKLDSELENPLV